MKARFVIHIHRDYGPLHYDFMIAAGTPMPTWQFLESPLVAMTGRQLDARRIQDHRTHYLDYEGPVSKGRGSVRKLEEGTCRVLEWTENALRIRFSGKRLDGLFRMDRQSGDRWVFSFAPE